MLSEYNSSSSIKADGLIATSKLIKSSKLSSNNCVLFNNKDINRRFSNMKSIDITSRLGQFAWRQMIPSDIVLPIIFRHNNREEYLCVQMIKIHLLSRISSETISYWMQKSPIRQFSVTKYEAELFHSINIFHSNGFLSNNNQLDYSKLETASITPFHPFLKFYQFIYSNSQSLNTNQFWISSHLSSSYNKSMTDKEKEVVTNMYQSSKNVLSKKSEPNNSFCRQIIFHGKEILSYCTTSSIHLNEKDNQTISCLSIKDIVSTYFPWSSIEQFIQICRKKQITRFKPDKSTDCDSTLRLVNIQDLENHWNFILKELLPNTQTLSSKQNDQKEKDESSVQSSEKKLSLSSNCNDILSSNVNNENATKIIQFPLKETLIENCSIEIENSKRKDNENNSILNNCSMESNDQIKENSQSIKENDNNENEIEMDLLENKEDPLIHEENSLLNKKIVKKTRRRRMNCFYSTKRRRKQKCQRNIKEENPSLLDNDKELFWMKKYSIESFSILVHRYHLPLD